MRYAISKNISSVLYSKHVSGTFHYRTISGLHNPSQILRCFVFFSWMCLLTLIVYSARILEEFHLIHSLYTTIYHPPYSFITQSVDDGGNIPISIFRYVLLTTYGCLASLYIYIMYMTSWSQLNT